MNFKGAEMPEGEWVERAVKQLSTFVEMHQDDATRLVEDLRRSWPALGPEDAVSCFFQPLLRQSYRRASDKAKRGS